MTLLFNSANRQVAGFAIATIGWILFTTSMGLVEWRLWYMENPSHSTHGLACVGIWRICIYHQQYNSNLSHTKSCHQYTYYDAFLPVSIRVSQHLLLAANLLGLLGKASITFALRNVYMSLVWRNSFFNPLVFSGILYITASVCVSVTVLWNYYSVVNVEGIAFPPSFRVPFKPDAQEAGSAIFMAALAAFLMFSSGMVFCFYSTPLDRKVHPKVSTL
ncbi:claudin-34-like [Ochotona princeps]|uniref:claudin-34-like n=1 Tax=Ochotona princeps TaxID=9978 RepID=UPI0027146D5E|nr:claudin-34-like [Ochotona princeps]XP_058515334.1 claudin-34-like [Ochotona princeps]